jgi:hypothetical protein
MNIQSLLVLLITATYSKCYCVAGVTKAFTLIQGVERWIVCTPLSVNV